MSPMNPRLLRPTASGASHPETRDWAARVTANGGTVSSSTLRAVDTFCRAIDAAGIRDRFYRLSLMAGSNISAALVPLYRGPTRGGSTFGDATDTNNNFVSEDYVETGTTGGLKGNGSTKYLATGLPMTFLGTNQMHLFAGFDPQSDFFRFLIGARANLAGAVTMEINYNGTTANRPRVAIFSSGNQPTDHASPITGRTQYLVQFDGTNPVQVYARNVSLGMTATAGAYSSTNTTPFLIFAGDQTGTGIIGHCATRIDSYSIGASFTSTAERTALHDAMSDFRTALGRT